MSLLHLLREKESQVGLTRVICYDLGMDTAVSEKDEKGKLDAHCRDVLS